MCKKELNEAKLQPRAVALVANVATLDALNMPITSWRITVNGADASLVFKNMIRGGRYVLFIDIPAAQARIITLPGGAKTPAGDTTITLTATAAQTFVLEFTKLAEGEFSVWNVGSAAGAAPVIPATMLKSAAALDTTLRQVSDNTPNNSQLFLATDKSAFAGALSVGQSTAPAARLDVKGSGSTSATTALQILNSAGAQTMKATDDGCVFFGTSSQAKFTSAGQLVMDRWRSKTSFEDDWLEWGTDELKVVISNTQFASFKSSGIVFGGTAVNGSAIFQVDSTTKGFLPPRMTTTQKNAIVTPPAGLMVYDTTLNALCVFRGSDSTWRTITAT